MPGRGRERLFGHTAPQASTAHSSLFPPWVLHHGNLCAAEAATGPATTSGRSSREWQALGAEDWRLWMGEECWAQATRLLSSFLS